jgi:methylmalonyl-CoA carboxyltransferase large subunit
MVKTVKTKDLLAILEQVQAQLGALAERVERLESGGAIQPPKEAATAAPAATEPPPVTKPDSPEITEAEILAISAALAAYLGVRIRIRQIRLLSSQAWAQQGRVSIQASHNLHN